MLLAGLLPAGLPASGAQLQLQRRPADTAGRPESSLSGLWRWPQTSQEPCGTQLGVTQFLTYLLQAKLCLKMEYSNFAALDTDKKHRWMLCRLCPVLHKRIDSESAWPYKR